MNRTMERIGFWDTNRFPNLGQKSRSREEEKKEKIEFNVSISFLGAMDLKSKETKKETNT